MPWRALAAVMLLSAALFFSSNNSIGQVFVPTTIWCSEHTGLCADYDADGNQVCSPADPFGWITDTDGDGQVDCNDRDDDGDYLTDKYEDNYDNYYEQSLYDNDGDTLPDSKDLLPHLGSNPSASITFKEYRESDCDVGDNPADPFIPTNEFGARVASAPWINLIIPSTWSESNHVDDRGDDVVQDLLMNSQTPGLVSGGTITLSSDVLDYQLADVNDVIAVSVRIGLKDHDVTFDDRMDLILTDGVEVGEIVVRLNYDRNPASPTIWTTYGDDGGCIGRVGIDMSDTVPKDTLNTAQAWRRCPTCYQNI